MDKAGTAGMAIVPTFDEFTPAAVERGTSRTLATAGARGGKVFGDRAGKSVGTSFLTHIKRVAALGGGLLVGAAVKNFVGDSIDEARESQKVGALTVSTLKATGHEAGVTNKEIGKLAHTLSHKAAIDDEQIQAGENVLLSYRSVRNEVGKGNDIFSKATKRATDLAAALAGQRGGTPDVAAASKIVGKALDDPVKGMSALRKAGVDFSAQQIANVKNLVATGKTMDAQKVILGALADRYKGAAASQATEGAKVGVAWKNVEEQVGNAILPLVDDIEQAILTKGMPTFRHWANEFRYHGIPAIKDFAGVVEDKGLPVLKKLYEKGKPLAEAIFPALGTALGDTASALETAAPYAERLVKAFSNMPSWAQKTIVAGGAGLYLGNKLAPGATSSLLGLVTKKAPLPVYVVNEGFGPKLPGGKAVKDGEKVAAAAATTGLEASSLAILGGGATIVGLQYGSQALGTYLGKKYQDGIRTALGVGGAKGPGLDILGTVSSAAQNAKLDNILLRPLGQAQDKLNGISHTKVAPDFKLHGFSEWADKMTQFRDQASKPINVQVVLRGIGKAEDALSAAGGAFGNVFGTAPDPFAQNYSRGQNRAPAGVTVHIDKVVAQNYDDLMRKLQHRAQRAQLDGVRNFTP